MTEVLALIVLAVRGVEGLGKRSRLFSNVEFRGEQELSGPARVAVNDRDEVETNHPFFL